jgi:penicillin-binding protein 1C
VSQRRRLARWGGAMGAVALVTLAAWVVWPLPPGLTAVPPSLSLTLEDRHGLPLRTTRAGDGSLAGWLPIGELDPQLIQAFVATEDRRFFEHRGVDVAALARALTGNVRRLRTTSGASTITMQLARLLRPGPRTLAGKARQALWALRLERQLTKQQILEQYLNRVPLGQGAVGVPAAAQLYFGAGASRLSLGQAALLAGLASAPSLANPLVAPERGAARREVVLERMTRLGFVTAEAARQARGEGTAASGRRAPFLAPHFTSRLITTHADSAHVTGRWRTSLDLTLQAALEEDVRHTVALLADRGVRHAAIVVLDNERGEVLAWVGSPDFWADSMGQVDMVVSPRQPGSALKPFLFGLAFDRGLTPATVLPDLPRTYQTPAGPYQPRNYDRRYHGPVRIREALASSFNVPAVDLTDRIGAPALLALLRSAGFTTLTRGADHYGLGLVIGNGDVTLLELANAYRGLANGGEVRPVSWWAVPLGAPGAASGSRFLSPLAAALVLDILADPAARVPGFGTDTPFDFPFPVAVKTGTSHHFTDNWAVAVTGAFTVAVWAGNFTGRPMRQVSGITGAGPLLHRAVLQVARRYPPGALPHPAALGATGVRVCRLSGGRAGPFCPASDEWLPPGAALTPCTWHDEHGGIRWPAEYASWAHRAGGVVAHTAMAASPASPGDVSHSDTAFRIVSPLPGDRYQVPAGVDPRYASIGLRAVGRAGDEPVRWLVDGMPTPERWRLAPGRHAIRAVAASGRTAEVVIEVRSAPRSAGPLAEGAVRP